MVWISLTIEKTRRILRHATSVPPAQSTIAIESTTSCLDVVSQPFSTGFETDSKNVTDNSIELRSIVDSRKIAGHWETTMDIAKDRTVDRQLNDASQADAIVDSVANKFSGSKAPWLENYPACVPRSIVIPEVAAWQPLLTTAADFPDRVACRYMAQDLTYAELATASRRCAEMLVRMGVKPGDRVGILLPNIPEYPVALNGVWMAGAIAVAISPLSVASEVSSLLKVTDCQTVISLDMLAPLVLDADVKPQRVILASIRKHMSVVKRIGYSLARLKKLGFEKGSGPKRYWLDAELDESAKNSNDEFEPLLPASLDDPAYILATGGTTGAPKAVTLSHRNLVSNSQQIWHWAGGRRGVDSMLAVIPFFHSYGLTTCLMTGITLGATLVMYHRFNPKVAIEILVKERTSIFPSVPLMLDQMNAILREGKHKVLGLRYVISGGAALDRTIAEEFHNHTGAQVVEGYGLSEASPVTHTGPLDGSNIPGTIGLPLPGTEAKIVDAETGSLEMPPGEVGELMIRGPQVMLGYWNDPEATAIAIDDEGWLYTGDLATCDKDGFFCVVDRKKDLIITGGYNVYPTDVEHTLRNVDGVIDVAVVGVPDRARGEIVKAIVAVEDLAAFDRKAFEEFVDSQLARHKRPKLTEFVEGDLPRNFLGKVLRRKLRNDNPVAIAQLPQTIQSSPQKTNELRRSTEHRHESDRSSNVTN